MKRLLALLLAALVLFAMPVSLVYADGEDPAAEPPASENAAPKADEQTPPPADEQTPPAANETIPPADEQTPPAADETAPPADEQTPPAVQPTPETDLTDEGSDVSQASADETTAAEGSALEEGAASDEETTPAKAPEVPHDQPQWFKSLEYWERERQTIELTGDLREDVLIIARSQLGYSADRTCYTEDASGKRLLYTRYGAWDGATFSDWCDSFVSFCIFYAGNDSYPTESSCRRHMFALKQAGYWREWNSYIPQKGDIVFFSFTDQYPMPSHVGLVEEVIWGNGSEPSRLITIEGNQLNPHGDTACVRRMERLLTDVVGYGTYEKDKVYPQGYSYRTDGWQTIDPDSNYFVEYPVEKVLRFLGLQNTRYYAYWFPNGPVDEPATEPEISELPPNTEAVTVKSLLKPISPQTDAKRPVLELNDMK